ncbi:MAG: thioredoxin reductase [Chloroflexota bacterium]|nr:thioredoxin reductase [Chloroflexota bacterium]
MTNASDVEPGGPVPLAEQGDAGAQTQAGRSPVLDPAQLEVLGSYGTQQDIAPGDVLFAEGDETYDLIVVLEGEVQIVANAGQTAETVIATYEPGGFLGEISLLTGQRAFLAAIARSAGRVLRVPVANVREVMAQEALLSELILRTFLIRHANLTRLGSGLTLIGSRFAADTRRILEVLARNRLVSTWLDLEVSPEAEGLLRELDVPVDALPIVIVPGRPLLRNPSTRALLDALGLSDIHEAGPASTCDLLVVGGGPSGLSAAVYGASEGLATVLAEDTAFGGQAGTSSLIENYLGFPAGLSGEEIAARAVLQAEKFGVRMKLAAKAVALSTDGGLHRVTFEDGDVVAARALIIATGARYNRLPVERLAEFEGVGVYYAATQMEAQACTAAPVAIVGGGNAAGQAALFLSRTSPRVTIIIRGASLATSMSRYLIDQIDRDPRIEVRPHTEVSGLLGRDEFEGVDLVESVSHQTSKLAIGALFVFIGAKPGTDWLDGQLATDSDGFLLTGPDIPLSQREPGGRTPLFLETSRAGIFAVGDVRSGSIKRVATAIGEGSMAVRLVFDRLEDSGASVSGPLDGRSPSNGKEPT